MSDKEVKEAKIVAVHVANHIVEIYFDFHEIPCTEEDLKPVRRKIRKKSGSRIFLDTSRANFGILTLKENLAITPDEGMSFGKAQKIIKDELKGFYNK